MTPAELRTAHDSLGVSAEFIAARVGCHVNMIWRYEHPARKADVPDHVADAVRDMLNDYEVAAERLVDVFTMDGGITRAVTEEDREEQAPEIRGYGPTAYGLLIADVQRRTDLPVVFL